MQRNTVQVYILQDTSCGAKNAASILEYEFDFSYYIDEVRKYHKDKIVWIWIRDLSKDPDREGDVMYELWCSFSIKTHRLITKY